MTGRRRTAVTTRSKTAAVALVAVWATGAVGSIVLAWMNRSITFDLRSLDSSDFVFVLGVAAFTAVFLAIGALIATRARNPIGWLLIAIAMVQLGLFFEQYAIHGIVVAPGSLPATDWAQWMSNWLFPMLLSAVVLTFLLFPTGKPKTARWRALVVAAPLASILLAADGVFGPGPMEGNFPARLAPSNPAGLSGAGAVIDLVTNAGAVLLLVAGLAGIVCLVLRFLGSQGTERQQIKWLVLVALATALVIACDVGAGSLTKGSPHLHDAVDSIFWAVIVTTLMLGMPVAIGAAIFRYRLYDIDRIISRTLSYAVITAILVGAYIGLVIVFESMTRPLTGRSDLAVAASTLVAAALFIPLRSRVQSVVDHRFNRRQYDAEQTIGAFTARLRDEVDIDTLAGELRDIVDRTMQPSSTSLWLRDT
jgi:hypothetical protein